MSARHFTIATAGHVDHGKSGLVKALTGIDPDRLPEEKARGITIDLGFAHLKLGGEGDFGESIDIGIVDVPGHEDFVKNMVAGVGSIDLALFVVAADDGWMPQTEEHLQILTYLGVTQAVIALTKIDLVPGKEPEVAAALREQFRDTVFAKAPLVETSVSSGRGLDELKQALVRELARTSPQRDLGKPRLPVDRVFTLRGIGTVVTGTLIGGTLRRSQTVVIHPSGQTDRIRSLQNFNEDAESSEPGARTALNLPGVEISHESAPGSQSIHRGDVVTLPALGGVSRILDVLLERSARLVGSRGGVAPPLKNGARVRIHHGSGNYPAHLHLFDARGLAAGNQGIAQLRLERPVFAFVGDRFILRDWAEQRTLGGGVVLDPDGNGDQFRNEAQRAYLDNVARAPSDLVNLIFSQLARDGAVPLGTLLLKSRFSATEISEAVQDLATEGAVVASAQWVADKLWWLNLRRQAADAIDAEHGAQPDSPGLRLSELRGVLRATLAAADVFENLVTDLCQDGFLKAETVIKRATHRPSLPPDLQDVGIRLQRLLAEKPFDPRPRRELVSDPLAQKVFRFLLESGEVVELSDEVIVSAEGFSRMRDAVVNFIAVHGASTVSELRQHLGTTRRIIIPLLERLDRDGVTIRRGEKRLVPQ